MVPPCSHGISRVPWYSGYRSSVFVFAYMALTFFGVLSHTLRLTITVLNAVQTPEVFLPLVWPLPRSLATTSGISVDFSSSPYLDVSVQAVPFQLLWIHKRMTEYCSAGFPHSDILGSMAAFASPGLFVDRYVLHRLPMPRHSPCALISLTFVRIMCPLVLVNFSTRLYCSVYPFQKNQLDICYIISLFPFHIYLYSVFKVHGGLERTRTSDLTLIRRAL